MLFSRVPSCFVIPKVHVGDIPGDEWEVILAERCGLPPSHCKLLVKVLHELQVRNRARHG